MTQATPKRKKPFSSFIFKDACQYLGINDIQRWNLSASPVPISEFFQQRLVEMNSCQ